MKGKENTDLNTYLNILDAFLGIKNEVRYVYNIIIIVYTVFFFCPLQQKLW